MNTTIKIIVSIAIFCGGSFFVTLLSRGMGFKASTGGIGPFIIYPAIIAAIWAVWKKGDKKENNDGNHHTLNKN